MTSNVPPLTISILSQSDIHLPHFHPEVKKLNDVALKLLAKAAYANAEKEANSACLFIGYQPTSYSVMIGLSFPNSLRQPNLPCHTGSPLLQGP